MDGYVPACRDPDTGTAYCINETELCDGNPNCIDGADEGFPYCPEGEDCVYMLLPFQNKLAMKKLRMQVVKCLWNCLDCARKCMHTTPSKKCFNKNNHKRTFEYLVVHFKRTRRLVSFKPALLSL